MSRFGGNWVLRALSIAAGGSLVGAGVVLVRRDSWAAALLVLPGLIGGWAVVSLLRANRPRAAGLVELAGGPDSVDHLLKQVRQLFDADVSAVLWAPAGSPAEAVVARSGPGDSHSGGQPSQRELRWAGLAAAQGPRIVSSEADTRRLAATFGATDLGQSMVVPLVGETGATGLLVVAGRRLQDGQDGKFGPDDLDVLDTLGRLVTTGLEKDQLEDSLSQAGLLERQLVFRATHDSLTGLANRALLSDHITVLLQDDDAANLSLLLIDVEQHLVIDPGSCEATVEEVLDQLLVIAAQRLVGVLRDGDLAARVGDRELAVLARVATDGRNEATRLGERIIQSLSRPASVGGATVALHPTVAVVLGRPFDDSTDLITAADLGLLAAKASSGGRVELVTR